MGALDVWEIRGYKVYLGVATEVVAQYKQDVVPSEVWDLKQEKRCQKVALNVLRLGNMN